jgi:hypothetical protein
MASHLRQPIANHVTLELIGGINGGYGPEQLGWVRILPNGGIQSGPGGGNFVVPRGKRLVVTDLDWQYDDHGTSNAGALVTLRLFVVSPNGSDRRMIESAIVLSSAGQGGTVTSWTAGAVFGPGTKIGIDTSPLPTAHRLQHAMLHGYLI